MHHNDRSAEIDFAQPLPLGRSQRTSGRQIYVLEDDESSEHEASHQQDDTLTFQFAPAHRSVNCQIPKRGEANANEHVPKRIHRLDSDDDLDQASYTIFQ